MVTVVDEDGTITYTSPSIETVLGYRPEDRIGDSLFRIVHHDDRPTAVDEFNALCEGSRTETRFEYRVRHRDGTWLVFEGVAVDLRDNDIIGSIVLYSRDVTERNNRERELERTNRRLEEFAGVVSHDLRTPLDRAQTYAQFAESSTSHDDFRALDTAHQRMEQIITNLLTMARAGATLTDPSPVEIESVVVEAWEVTRTGDATLECDLVDGWTVMGDREQLLHVFENLFRNSIEHGSIRDRNESFDAINLTDDVRNTFSTDDEPKITVSVSHLGEDSDQGFVVEDNGVGIPAQQREFVFERGHTTSQDGAGFGLAIVHDVIEAHGWEIELQEGIDGGARFEVITRT